MAQGRYVCFVDSDDYFAQTDFRTLYENAAQADADMAVFRMVREEDDWSLCRLDDYLEDEYITALAEKRFRWNLADKLFKTATLKEVVNRLPAATPNLSMAEDFCLSACFCALAKRVIKADAQTLYFYRDNPHSITNQRAISLATVIKHFADYKAIRELVLEFYRSAKVPHEIIVDVDRLYSGNAVFFYRYLKNRLTLDATFFSLIEEKLLQSFNHKAVSEFLVRENADLFEQFKNTRTRNPNQEPMVLLQNRSGSSVLPSLLEDFLRKEGLNFQVEEIAQMNGLPDTEKLNPDTTYLYIDQSLQRYLENPDNPPTDEKADRRRFGYYSIFVKENRPNGSMQWRPAGAVSPALAWESLFLEDAWDQATVIEFIDWLDTLTKSFLPFADAIWAKAFGALNSPSVIRSVKKLPDSAQNALKAILARTDWSKIFRGNPCFELDDFYKNFAPLRVSLIVPVYNVEKYLPDCLASIESQTYPSLEVIFVDDGSTDRSSNILSRFAANSRHRCRLIHKPNEGLGRARNTGLAVATGYYLYFLDSDDTIAPEAMSALYEVIGSRVDFVTHTVTGIALDAASEKETLENQKWFANARKASGVYAIGPNPKHSIISVAWNKLYKHRDFIRYRLRFTRRIHEDEVFFWQFITRCSKYYYLDQPLYCYRRHRSSIMGTRLQSDKALDAITVHSEICRFLRNERKLKAFISWADRDFMYSSTYLLDIIDPCYTVHALKLIHRHVWQIHAPDSTLRQFYWQLMRKHQSALLKQLSASHQPMNN